MTPRTGSCDNGVGCLPAVANEGVVLDFTVLDADGDGANEIYVVRTSGGDGTFYQSRTVQRVLTGTPSASARPGGARRRLTGSHRAVSLHLYE